MSFWQNQHPAARGKVNALKNKSRHLLCVRVGVCMLDFVFVCIKSYKSKRETATRAVCGVSEKTCTFSAVFCIKKSKKGPKNRKKPISKDPPADGKKPPAEAGGGGGHVSIRCLPVLWVRGKARRRKAAAVSGPLPAFPSRRFLCSGSAPGL